MVIRTSHHDYSSGLWPFATVGWPFETDTNKYKKYYPATVLETGYDILFFWVARMVIILHRTVLTMETDLSGRLCLELNLQDKCHFIRYFCMV